MPFNGKRPSDLKFNIKLIFSMSLLSAIPFVGTAVDYVMGTYAQHEANDLTAEQNHFNREFQREENEKEKAWNEKMWQLEKQYNTPAAQMQRYREAGLNPFLADSAKVGSGNTPAPVNAPMGASPSVGSFGAANYGSILGSLGQVAQFMLQDKQIDSNVANQQSQTLKTYVEAAISASKSGDKFLANKIIETGFRQLGVNEINQDFIRSGMKNELRKQELDNRIKSVEADVAEDVGMSQAKQTLLNMQQQFKESQAQVSLWDNIRELNDVTAKLRSAQTNSEWKLSKKYEAEIPVLRAQVKELNSRAYMEFAHGCLADAKTLTEDTLRQFWSTQNQIKALTMGIDYDILEADFNSDEWKRGVQKSWFGKFYNAWNYGVDQSIAKPLKSFMDIFGDVPKLKSPKIVRKRHENYMNTKGYKGYVEAYDYE